MGVDQYAPENGEHELLMGIALMLLSLKSYSFVTYV